MKSASLLLFPLMLTAILCTTAFAQDAQFPIVKGFGGIYEVPGSISPDPEIEYKLVIDLKSLQADKNHVNRGLNNVARMMNLHGLGGVKKENLSVVVVAHGEATEAILTNQEYARKNGVSQNPNIVLIDALKQAGAEIVVCGQSLIGRGFPQDEVYSDVSIGLSMLTVVTEYMHNGYQLLVFD